MHSDALAVLDAGTAARRLRDPLGVKEQQVGRGAQHAVAVGAAQQAWAARYRQLQHGIPMAFCKCHHTACRPAALQARLFLKLGRQADAEAAYRRLIAINTENYRYHEGLQAALQLPAAAAAAGGAAAGGAAAQQAQQAQQLSEEQRQRLADVYGELQREHPHSVAARRMPLDFLVRVAVGRFLLLGRN